MDITNRSRASSQRNHGAGMSSGNSGSRKQHVDLILLDGLVILDRLNVLSNTLTFTSQESLINAEAVAVNRQKTAIGGNLVTDGDVDDVTGNEVLGLDCSEVTITEDFRIIGGVFLKRSDSLLGARLLGDTDDGIEDEDGEDLFRQHRPSRLAWANGNLRLRGRRKLSCRRRLRGELVRTRFRRKRGG